MIYRTNATGLREEEERADAAELEELRSAVRTRRRRAAIAIVAVVLGSVSSLFVAARLSPARARLHCHQVQIEWENARAVPGPSWTACEWR